MIPARPVVVSVSADASHRFSKPVLSHITLVAGHGVEGDAHAGPSSNTVFLRASILACSMTGRCI